MDQPTSKTSGSYSTFVSKCSDLEEQLIDKMADSSRRDQLVGRVRTLRRDFESWPCSPPSKEQRSAQWMALVELAQYAESGKNG